MMAEGGAGSPRPRPHELARRCWFDACWRGPVPRQQGATGAKGRGRARRGTVRHERSCWSVRASALPVPLWRSRPRPPRTASLARHHGCRPRSLFSIEHDKFTSTGDAACSTAANLMIGRQPPMERRTDGVPETCPTSRSRQARFSVDPAARFRPFQNQLGWSGDTRQGRVSVKMNNAGEQATGVS